MDSGDLDLCVELVTNEGWVSETREVFEDSLTFDPHGCFVAEEDGNSIGIIVATAYNRAGFLGELIVRPEYRGRGLGRLLLEHGIDYLHKRGCNSIYLDGDTPAVPLYERLGFATICKSLRFIGTVTSGKFADVRPMTMNDRDVVSRLDRDAFGDDRTFFLSRRLKAHPELCYCQTRNSEVIGFVMARPGRGVVSVAPWISHNIDDTGFHLLRALACDTCEVRLRIGILESNRAGVSMLRTMERLEESEPSWRMVLGADIGLGASDQILAIGSPAKG
jgi:predicted N-acetyltransferase YhbS